MLSFLLPKSKVKSYQIRELSIEDFEIIGIDQINPYCKKEFDEKIFITVVSLANDFKKFDEKEGLISTKYFAVRRCPKCRKNELIPIKLKINLDSEYLSHEEEIAFDAYEEFPSKKHFSSIAKAYCNNCSSCFEIKIKTNDRWVKQARKIKNKDLITKAWVEYILE